MTETTDSSVETPVRDDLDVSKVPQIMSPAELVAAQRLVAGLHVEERVVDYAVRIARATREWSGITIGAGPRGSLAMVRAARAGALLNGRDFVTPDDVKTAAVPALRHRITLAPELEIEGHRPDDTLGDILRQTEAPRQ